MSSLTRAEHVAWAKARALEYLDAGQPPAQAMLSLASDFNKHAETRADPQLLMGFKAQLGGLLTSAEAVRGFLENLH